MNILITICGRGGSKGIPGKNIKLLNNKPLIWYSIETAKKFAKEFKNIKIALSTDSELIKAEAHKYGLSTDYVRPADLGSDTAGKIDVIRDILLHSEKEYDMRFDYILDLDITSPLRNIADLKAALDIIESDKNAANIISVSHPSRNPYFNMVEKKYNGYYGVVKSPESFVASRQTAPKVFDINGSFYFYRRNFFEQGFKGAITYITLVYKTPHMCFDLDYPIDFEFMEYLIKEKKLDFTFDLLE